MKVTCDSYDLMSDTYELTVTRTVDQCKIATITIAFRDDSSIITIKRHTIDCYFNDLELIKACHDQMQDAMMQAIGMDPYTTR